MWPHEWVLPKIAMDQVGPTFVKEMLAIYCAYQAAEGRAALGERDGEGGRSEAANGEKNGEGKGEQKGGSLPNTGEETEKKGNGAQFNIMEVR